MVGIRRDLANDPPARGPWACTQGGDAKSNDGENSLWLDITADQQLNWWGCLLLAQLESAG